MAMDLREHDAIERFAHDHVPALLRLAYLLCGGRAAEAEDAVNSVLLRLIERGLDGLNEPLAYARRALLNEVRDNARRDVTKRRVLSVLASPLAPPATDVADHMALMQALRTLDERTRIAIVLRYYADLPDDDIAETLGCARSTVRSLVHRALPKLRAVLEPNIADATVEERR